LLVVLAYLFLVTWSWLSDASLHTSIVPACDRRRRLSRACRESRDNGRREDPSRGRRGSEQSSAPAGYDRRRGCRSSPRCHWSNARARLCATPSSASWAFECKHGCKHHVSEANSEA